MEQLATQDVNSVSASSTTQLLSKIQSLSAKVKTLEKELYYYKKTSRDLKKKLQTLMGKTHEGETGGRGSSTGRDCKSERAIEGALSQLSTPLELSVKTSTNKLGKRESREAHEVPVTKPVLTGDSGETGIHEKYVGPGVQLNCVTETKVFPTHCAGNVDYTAGPTHSTSLQVVSSDPEESQECFEEGQTTEGGEDRLTDSLESVQMKEIVRRHDGRVSWHLAGKGREGETKQAKLKGKDFRKETAITQSATLATGNEKHGGEKMIAVGSSCVESCRVTSDREMILKSRKQLRQLRSAKQYCCTK